VVAAFVSPTAGPWNPYQHALVRSGARVLAFASFKAALESHDTPDAVIIDATDASLSQLMPTLRGVCRAARLAAAPKLLLARRSDEAEERVAADDLPIHVYASPIRIKSMLQAVRRLLRGQE
jgi:DNA-binding response OmpR family regulator